jgi:PAS domain S-box-containing protein
MITGKHAPLASERVSGDERPAAGHRVQFYDDDGFLVDEVARYIGAGLGAGEAGIVIATAAHRGALDERLHANGIDVAAARAHGRYVTLDAAVTLAGFMVDGRPDEARFVAAIGDTIERAAAGGQRPVRAFGEMVALLWLDGKHDASLALEKLWNALAQRLPFTLVCAYPLRAFRDPGAGRLFRDVCDAHSRVIPAETYTALRTEDERLRAISELQQKASALAGETAQRQEAQDTARSRHQTLRALVEASPVPIVVVDPYTTVRLWNPAAERVFGWSEQEVIGGCIPIIPPEKLPECASMRDAVLRGETFDGVESYRTRRDGSSVDVRISAAPLADGGGVVREIVLLFEDVTERNRAETARQEAYEAERAARAEAEAANHAKDEFLAMLGHELRNPLSAVRNAIVTARLDESRRERALEIAGRQADHLGRLVDDLLDVARITQRRINLHTQRLRFASVVERAVETTRPLLEERAHVITVTLPRTDVQIVDGDATRLEQVVVNLLTNAAKYTAPGGHIEVTAERQGGEIVLRVRDDGIGMAPEVLARVFDLFAQADRTLDRAQGGLGIGLTVVRRLVELHGGKVEAHSAGLGKGAEFVVRLPAAAQGSDELADSAASDGIRPGMARVLVVEDNHDAAETMMMLMELLGHRVRVAHDGIVALEMAQANPPDVMLVDIGLPGIDGYEVARRVRQHAALKQVVLVALTGYGREEDRDEALLAGFDYHLVKPVEVRALQALVDQLATPAPAPTRTLN